MGFFGRLNIGTKIISVVSFIVILCVILIVLVVSFFASQTLERESDNLLSNTAARYKNLIVGATGEIFSSTISANAVIESMIGKGFTFDEGQLINILENVVDTNRYSVGGFIIIKKDYTQKNIKGDHYLLPTGEFAILSIDEDAALGGVSTGIMPKDLLEEIPSILNSLNKSSVDMTPSRQVNIKGKTQYLKAAIVPIIQNGKHVGVIGNFLNLEMIDDILASPGLRVFEGDKRIVIDTNGSIIFNSATEERAQWRSQDLRNVNTHPSAKEIVEAAKKHQSGIYTYTNIIGQNSKVALNSFEIWPGTDLWWTVVSLAPFSAINKPIVTLQIALVIVGIVAVALVSLVMFIYIKSTIASRIRHISHTLFEFFDYLNHKIKVAPEPLVIRGRDELGAMGEAINENIASTKNGLQQDSKAVEQSVATAKTIESGDLRARITETPHNPQLNELKEVLNHMLDDLQTKIGSDTNEIARVFDSYTKLDFTTEVKDASGRVEVVTNTLGEEIRKMLSTSAAFAQTLGNEAQGLQEAVNKLTNLTNSQASSLEQTAQAVEEITSSMQNVSSKTSEVIQQSEDIKNVIGIIRDIADQTNLLA
ncbi:methyl-accepting chemotaxis protein, partial [Helicobacter typhlonius]|uniref:methyl-accepting chemotaxis protein n=1 Tax=Helicobacter typhlonius TaxID=76936 RepID=UPI002FE41487